MMGKIERGFDFLGYHFGPDGLTVAKETLRRFVERAVRLYEQEPTWFTLGYMFED